ncbi:MAG: YmdB family metallophosphoesterase, partial [Candidatus Saccharimonadales bacterium]
GDVGLSVVEKVLPNLKRNQHIDLVIAQAENVTDGKGVSPEDFSGLQRAGVDFCSGGNWSIYRPEIFPALNDPAQPIIRPANYPAGTPGLGYKFAGTKYGKVLVISLLGHIVGRDADKPTDNPLKVVDKILEKEKTTEKVATIVNFHGDYSSEKVVIGHYLDGRVSAVIGDHWHVPTADGRVLPKGTAHQTDVGMCGALDGSLGVKLSSVIPRWRNEIQTRNELETTDPTKFNAALIETDNQTGLARSINQVQKILNN